MLQECIDIFKLKHEKQGDALILDNYRLKEGFYISVKNLQVDTIFIVDKNTDVNDVTYRDFAVKDYYSSLLSMNKPVDPKKQIFSNNYLSLFSKVDAISNKNTFSTSIDAYFNAILNAKSQKDKKKAKLAIEAENFSGVIDTNKFMACREWVEHNFFEVYEQIVKEEKAKNPSKKLDDKYFKVFFDEPIELYKKENNRYLLPVLYNTNDYNVEIENVLYGVPNDNMALNNKKPYLKNLSRKSKLPYMISFSDALVQKNFFDYLSVLADNKKTNIYIDLSNQDIYGTERHELLNTKDSNDFYGYYLRILKSKDLDILDFSLVPCYFTHLEGFYIKNIFNLDYSKYEKNNNKKEIRFGEVEDLATVKEYIESILFKNCLANNYFEKKLKLNGPGSEVLKEAITFTNEAFFEWFYKGNSNLIKPIFKKTAMQLIKSSIVLGDYFRAREQYMIMDATLRYLKIKGDNGDMTKKEAYDSLSNKMNDDEFVSLENDSEFYCAVGQMVKYCLRFSKSSKKPYSLVSEVFNIKNSTMAKQYLLKLFKKYSYDANFKSRRFERLYSLIINYDTDKTDEESIMFGFFQDLLIYNKTSQTNKTIKVEECENE